LTVPSNLLFCHDSTVKDSLVETLESLLAKRTDLDYIVIECSGMADPGPVASVFWLDDALESRIRLDGVVTCVDAKNILHQLQSTSSAASFHENDGDGGDGGDEAARQIAYADRIIVNKIDLLEQDNKSNGDSIQSVIDKIKDINPTASMRQTTFSVIKDIDWILDANCFDAERVKDVEVEFQQSVENEARCFNPKCTVDHTTFGFCGLCETDTSSSPSVTLHQHTNTVGTIALFSIGSIDLHKLNSWLASILWPNQDEMDKVLRARLEESLRTGPITPAPKVITEGDGSIIYRVKGVVSVQHSIGSAGNVVPASNDFVDDGLSGGFVNERDGLDGRRYIVQAVHDLWDVTASKNLFWNPNDTRCCKIIVIGKRLDEKALRDGFMECFS
jgi:G3E family GTPase